MSLFNESLITSRPTLDQRFLGVFSFGGFVSREGSGVVFKVPLKLKILINSTIRILLLGAKYAEGLENFKGLFGTQEYLLETWENEMSWNKKDYVVKTIPLNKDCICCAPIVLA